MWDPIQILTRILFLQALTGPVLGSHTTRSLITNALKKPELNSEFDESLIDLGNEHPVEEINAKLDAFLEPFSEGIIEFDDDFRDYTDAEFIEVEIVEIQVYSNSSRNAKANRIPNSRAIHKPLRKELFGKATIKESYINGTTINGTLAASEPAEPATTEPPVPVDLEPTLTEFAAEDRTPALISQICRSREFQPTLENWWISGADQWLKDYTVANENLPLFKIFGLVGSIANEYLDIQDFGCTINPNGGFRPETCRIDCLEVVEKIDDIEEAKKIFFILSGVVGLAERVGAVHNAIRLVPQGVSSLVENMPTKAGLNTPIEEISDVLFNSVDSALFAASPWIPTAKIYQDGYDSLQAAKYHYDVAVQVSSLAAKGTDPYKWDKAFDSTHGMSLAEIDLAPKGYADGTVPIPEGMSEDTWYSKAVLRTMRALEDARAFVVEIESGNLTEARDEGFELFKELFVYDQGSLNRKEPQDSEVGFESSLRDAVRRAKITLAGVLANLLQGDISSVDGTTDLSTLLRYGNYLPSGPDESISNLKKVNVAEIITRDVFMKLFDSSIREQSVYISCTEDKQHRANPRKDLTGAHVDSCNRDNTGPQDLKACFGNMVCYLYEWNERSMGHMSRNRAPKKHEDWDEKPWSISAEDIILSSVAHSLQKDFSPQNTTEEADFIYQTITLDTLRDPRSAQHFKIPVCFSAHNWNTKLDGWNTLCDTSRHCTAKNLPCQCGPSGKDTQAVWGQIGLSNSTQHDFYSATLCPRQIQKKIPDPLERYLAYCHLGIKRRGSSGSRVDGPRRYQGKDKYCDIVRKAVEMQPNGLVSELYPETKFMLMCQIKKGGKGCNMYKRTFAKLWEETLKDAEVATLEAE